MYNFKDQIQEILENIDEITLGKPIPYSNNGRKSQNKHSAPLLYKNKSLNLQFPSCKTKNGVVNTSQRLYTELIFNNTNENNDNDNSILISKLLYALENKCCQLMFDHRISWFSTPELSLDDFEEMLTTCVRLNRTGDVTLRVNIPSVKRNLTGNITKCNIYDYKGDTKDLVDINDKVTLVPLLTIKEISFSSTSFNLVINMDECMLLNEEAKNNEIKEQKRNILVNLEEQEYNQDNQDNNIQQEQNNEHMNVNDNNIITELSDNTNTNTEEIDNERDSDSDSDTEQSDNEIEEDNDNDIDNYEGMEEIKDFNINDEETMSLKKPDEVYRELYKVAIAKAKKLRKVALQAYLDAKKIKTKFLIDNLDDSDEEIEEFEELGDFDNIGDFEN